MQAGQNPFEMIASLKVGDGKAAIFKHHADARNAIGSARIDRASAICDAADNRHPVGYAIAGDPHHSICIRALGAAIITGARTVHRRARLCVGTDFEDIGQNPARPSSKRWKRDRQIVAVWRNRIGYKKPIITNRIILEPHFVWQKVAYCNRAGDPA